jgi:hypothetical protein
VALEARAVGDGLDEVVCSGLASVDAETSWLGVLRTMLARLVGSSGVRLGI